MSIQWPSTSYAEDVARVMHGLLAEHGLEALTFRGIARRAGMSPGTLTYQFESRDLMLARCTGVIARLLIDDLLFRRPVTGSGDSHVVEMVARDAGELADLKVWWDLTALGRTHPLVGQHVRDAETRLQTRIGHRTWLALQAIWVDQLVPGRDLDPDRARALLRELLPQTIRS